MKISSYVAVFTWVLSLHAQAQQAPIDTFLRDAMTPTYDCPSAEILSHVDLYLAEPALTVAQKFSLQQMQTHGQICNGNNDLAEATLLKLVADPAFDQQSRDFASALYQLGFIYDVRSDPKKCDYYQQAHNISEQTHADVFLSASLGLITECQSGIDDGVRLGKLFTLLELYSSANNLGATAHIHNNIGLLFGGLGQHVLAAEQYLKAHKLGLDIYTGSNRLSILISAISSLMASGNFEQAKVAIDEFKQLNSTINLPLTNFWQLFAEAGYYYRTQQYENLRDSLVAWDAMKDQINSSTYTNLFRWYAAVLCLAEKDTFCLNAFLQVESQTSDSYKDYVGQNKDYLRFMTDVHFFLGDEVSAQVWFDRFADRLYAGRRSEQAASRILGVANLYAQINSLEARLQDEQQTKRQVIVSSSGIAAVLVALLSFLVYRRHIARETLDPVTKLLNNKTALRKIETIAQPSEDRSNALAIFDLGNFREVNRLVGSTKADHVMQQIAKTLRDITRSSDIIGRFAPEQFILCIEDIEESMAKKLFARVREALENTNLADAHTQHVSIQTNVSIYITNEAFNDIDDVLDDMLGAFSVS